MLFSNTIKNDRRTRRSFFIVLVHWRVLKTSYDSNPIGIYCGARHNYYEPIGGSLPFQRLSALLTILKPNLPTFRTRIRPDCACIILPKYSVLPDSGFKTTFQKNSICFLPLIYHEPFRFCQPANQPQ